MKDWKACDGVPERLYKGEKAYEQEIEVIKGFLDSGNDCMMRDYGNKYTNVRITDIANRFRYAAKKMNAKIIVNKRDTRIFLSKDA